MKRTISLKLHVSEEHSEALLQTQHLFAQSCNQIALHAKEDRSWNQVALHNICYSSIRKTIPTIGSQMVCNAIRKVCGNYKALGIKKSQEVPSITCKLTSSVHYCARTFSMKGHTLSLFSAKGRMKCTFLLGGHQARYLNRGVLREGDQKTDTHTIAPLALEATAAFCRI